MRTTAIQGMALARSWRAFALAGLAVMAFSAIARAEAPATYMQRVANELAAANRLGSAVAYANVIRKHADVPAIGIASLGSYARSLPLEERPAYYAGMVNWISRYAAKESRTYPVATVIVLGQSEEDNKGAYVDSKVTLRTGDTYDVRWWLVRRGGSFKVRDAQVIGMWVSPFLQSMFESYINENGGNPRALVMALNK